MTAILNGRFFVLLLDLDHTLLDSDASESLAFDQAMRAAGVAAPNQYFDAYREINRKLWSLVEQNAMTASDVRVTRFEQLRLAAGIEIDPVAVADAFSAGLGANGDLYPGTRATLATLAHRCRLALVSNGIGATQRQRIERLSLEQYFSAVVISSEVGVAKPAAAIFEIALRVLGGPPPATVLMVGDSLASDMQGGRNAGVATCWFNPRGLPVHDPSLIDFQISSLGQLLAD